MKAKFIYENLKFERGKDPKTAMEIGQARFQRDFEYGSDIIIYALNNLEKITEGTEIYVSDEMLKSNRFPPDAFCYLYNWLYSVKVIYPSGKELLIDPIKIIKEIFHNI